MLSIDCKDCNFKSMRKPLNIPKALIPILLFMIFGHFRAHTQNETNSTDLLLATLPEILVSKDGDVIGTASQWEQIRRGEILELFRDHMFGRVPESDLSISHHVKFMDRNALEGKAVMKEVELLVGNGSESMTITMLIYLPGESKGPVPLFLGLNFNGNHTIYPDPRITIPQSWVRNNDQLGIEDNRATVRSRGASQSRWPMELILSRGYGLATIYYGDIDPDFDDGFKNGINGLMDVESEIREKDAWGSIAAWAWGLSRAMDYFEEDADIDQSRVAVIGHSRLGKTSLWAGAQDERFALVISNNSGCGGAALSRRVKGETVGKINTSFPHWFCDRFNEYNDNEAALPVDQHMLMALMAPRPLYVASASEDLWADPYGEYLSLYYGSRAYELYGLPPLEDDQMPQVDQPVVCGNLGYHIRTGKHDLTSYDWEQYLDFADKQMPQVIWEAEKFPVTLEWIEEHIQKSTPRLVLTPEVEKVVREKLDRGDPHTQSGYELLQRHAESILDLAPLTYKKTGRRLLGVSREAIGRLTTLALVYRFSQEERYLKRLEEELTAVCTFSDWNPSHFLDVAEMAAGISLALDWAGEWLSPEVETLARVSLVEKALKPGIASSNNNSWITTHSNWNLVCHGGLSLAALAVFEDEPELASAILNQAIVHIPLALEPYAPGGIYPEGASYWFYATTYLTVAISAYESALGTDFGFTKAPGVMESAVFSQVMAGPSGDYFNYFDASLDGFHSMTHFGMLAWFSARSGEEMDWAAYESLLKNVESDPQLMKGTRFFSTHFLNCALLNSKVKSPYSWPKVWSGGGEEPIVVFRDSENNPDAFFLAAKGGMAADNHGNMDAGSFIFELDGVRWSVDPGNQSYHALEEIMGFALWNSAQDSRRWSLLTKNNFGHSTLTVNGEMHRVDGRSTLIRKDVRTLVPSFTFEMTPVFGSNIQLAERSYSRVSDTRLRITDEVLFSPDTRNLTWQMITQAEVIIKKKGLILQQEGKELYLEIDVEVPYKVNVVEVSPPPLSYDKDIPGLKRIEIQLERGAFTGDSGVIVVELTNDPW